MKIRLQDRLIGYAIMLSTIYLFLLHEEEK